MSLVIKANRFRAIIGLAVLGALVFWIVYGWDSGIDQVFHPEMYGRSLHFSAIVTYGLLFIYSSRHLETWNLTGFKNIVYSLCLTVLNMAAFEIIYILMFQHFQLGGIIQYLVRDWLFLSQYLFMFLIGLVGAIGLHYEVKGKLFRSVWIVSPYIISWTLAFSLVLWIFYPFPTSTLTYGTWTSSKLFPQTHYAYVHPSLYSANFLLHGVNIAVKALFALLQLLILRIWDKIECK